MELQMKTFRELVGRTVATVEGELTITGDLKLIKHTHIKDGGDVHSLELRSGTSYSGLSVTIPIADPQGLVEELQKGLLWLQDPDDS